MRAASPGPVVNLTGMGLQKLGPTLPCPMDTHTLILDKNQIIKLEHLEKCKTLMQLSVANNRLVRMMGVAKLTQLRVLNLPHNSIGYVEGLRDLVHLEWLNLAGNNLKTIDQINSCASLHHLDLSDNNLSQIGDLSKLIFLKTLLLHGNTISSLRAASACLPHSLTILSLAENEIRDLNEISFLAYLRDLEQLSIMNNPCVMATPSIPGFDYRPYIVSWCLNLKVLDGYVVSQKESLKAEWLYSQGKGRSYRPGQHVPLVQYLASVCPLTCTVGLRTAEDAKLEKILSKQRLHQRQLMHQGRTEGHPASSTPNRGLTPPSEHHSLSHEQSSHDDNVSVVQVDSWLGATSTEDHLYSVRHLFPCSGRASRSHHNDLYLEDIQTDEDKLNCSLLSSESTFMPVAPGLSPVSPTIGRWISGINSEQQANNTVLEFVKKTNKCDVENQDKTSLVAMENDCKESETEQETKDQPFPCPIPVNSCNHCTPSRSKYSDSSAMVSGGIQQSIALNVNQTLTETMCCKETNPGLSVSIDEDSDWLFKRNKAATKLQACWRGFHTRNYNPEAKDVRYEIRLSRMQEHIISLNAEVSKLKQERNEERIQRLVQEEAVQYLWSQVQSLQQWQLSINKQLDSNLQPSVPAASSSCPSHLSLYSSHSNPEATPEHASCLEVQHGKSPPDFPDSGFHSILVDHAHFKDSLCSKKSYTAGSGESESSVETVKQYNAIGLECPPYLEQEREDHGERSKDSSNSEQDNSLLQQYLMSVEQLVEADDGTSSVDRTEESRPNTADLQEKQDCSSSMDSPEKPHSTSSPLQDDTIHMPGISPALEEKTQGKQKQCESSIC